MPHFGLIDEEALGPINALLMRARLHIRCGKRRLRQGKGSLGILTLYDALTSGMQWYFSLPENKGNLQVRGDDITKDDRAMYEMLVRSRVIDKGLDYDALNDLVDVALKKDMSSYDYTDFLNDIESVMTQLGVMPFDEDELPPEDANTP